MLSKPPYADIRTPYLHDDARNRNAAALHPVALKTLALAPARLGRLDDALGDGCGRAAGAVVVDEGVGGFAGHFSVSSVRLFV